MDKPWTNHGQTTCICLGVEARFMETQIKIFIMFNLFPNTYLNIFQKNIVPIEPWTNRGTDVVCRGTDVFCRGKDVFCRGSGYPKNPLKTNSQTLGSFFGCFTVSPSCSPCHPKTQGCQSMW